MVGISLLFARYKWIVFFALISITLIALPVGVGHFTIDPTKAYNWGNGYLNMITNPIIWNFVYGVLIGLLFIQPTCHRLLSQVFSSSTLVYGVVVLAVWQYLSGFFGGQGLHQWGVGSALLFIAVLFYTSNNGTQFPQWLVRLGDISFSIYLLHLPVMLLIETIFQRLGYPIYGKGSAMFFLTIAMTIIISGISHQWLELKLSNTIKNWMISSKK